MIMRAAHRLTRLQYSLSWTWIGQLFIVLLLRPLLKTSSASSSPPHPTCPAISDSHLFISRYAQRLSPGPAARAQCSTDAQSREGNPLLRYDEGLPSFRSIEVGHVVPGIHKIVGDFEKGLEVLETQYEALGDDISWSKVSDPLERLEAPFEYGWGVVNHLNAVKNSQELREAHQQVQPLVVKATSKVTQSKPLYQAIKNLNGSDASLDTIQLRILKSAIRQARLGGVELTGVTKERFNEIRLRLATIATKFSNNVLDATKAFSLTLTEKKDVDGLPVSLLQQMAAGANPDKPDPENGPWKVTLDLPCFEPFMKHSTNRELREKLYKAYITRASHGDNDNTDIIQEIRTLRKEKAEILGYSNYAEMSLSTKMAANVDNVWSLIHGLRDKSKEAAQRDLKQLQDFASSQGFDGKIQLWDAAFWSERQREHLFKFNDEDLRPYFPLPHVLEGMFKLTSFLFNVQIKPADGDAETWHDDVRFFNVHNETGEHIASFYLDPYTRPAEKRGGAWMNVCFGKSELLNRKPVAYLVCNQTPPLKDKPSLMTFREVETLFHEFGHGLQHMLTTVPYAGAAGINNVEWDAVELPSQFMENWMYDAGTMKTVSGHYQTGDMLPGALFDQLVKARKYMAGSAMLRQLYFSAMDIELHTSTDHWMDVMRRVADEYTIMKPLQEDRFPCAFQHIFASGYAAGYYSYKWAEVMAADAFSAFEEVGLDNRESVAQVGRRFRDTILALGGGTHPQDVFKKFRGRDASPEPLLKTYGLV
ncbi:probable cytosolic oligopeptidase A [Patiria miniata]|uniref:oligopeptidase A n=1 Tax=Patiria miniata TaxID=46514 RepID=A0A913Z655_PATMI|nr:probable cytosolic oligopeptidase A [Patiria miniata]